MKGFNLKSSRMIWTQLACCVGVAATGIDNSCHAQQHLRDFDRAMLGQTQRAIDIYTSGPQTITPVQSPAPDNSGSEASEWTPDLSWTRFQQWTLQYELQVNSFRSQGRSNDAINLITNSLSSYPDLRSELVAFRGVVKLQAGQHHEGWGDLNESVQNHPCPVLARHLRVRAMKAAGRPDLANLEIQKMNHELDQLKRRVTNRQTSTIITAPQNQPQLPNAASNEWNPWQVGTDMAEKSYRQTMNELARLKGLPDPYPGAGGQNDPTRKMIEGLVRRADRLADPNTPVAEINHILNEINNAYGNSVGFQQCQNAANAIRNAINKQHQGLIDSRQCHAEILRAQQTLVEAEAAESHSRIHR